MTMQRGAMLVWTDIAPEHEAAFDEWYVRRHMPERILGVPGFLRGRRYAAVRGGPRHLALYDLASLAVLQSEPYHALRRTRDPESRALMPCFRNTVKAVGAVTVACGDATGGAIAVLPLVRPREGEAALRATIERSVLPAITAAPGVVSARYIENDAKAQAAVRANNTRPHDRFLDAALLIEALSPEHLASACTPDRWDAITREGASLVAEAAHLVLRFALKGT